MIYAHRGLHSKLIPENSMPSFVKAKIKHIPFELDIRILKDNNIVVFHDANLKRMTGVNKLIENCTYNEIKDLTLLDTSYKIPLFKEVLKTIQNEVTILIEIKSKTKRIIKYLRILLKGYTNYQIQSFHKSILNKLKKDEVVGLLSYNVNNNYDFLAMPAYLMNDLIICQIKKPLYLWGIKYQDIIKYQNYTDNFIVDYE